VGVHDRLGRQPPEKFRMTRRNPMTQKRLHILLERNPGQASWGPSLIMDELRVEYGKTLVPVSPLYVRSSTLAAGGVTAPDGAGQASALTYEELEEVRAVLNRSSRTRYFFAGREEGFASITTSLLCHLLCEVRQMCWSRGVMTTWNEVRGGFPTLGRAELLVRRGQKAKAIERIVEWATKE